jgi:YLP motif-containing protein 1
MFKYSIFLVNIVYMSSFQVRWADLEERKEQEKMRAVGFVVGHTNWDRMMDPTKGGSALTRTKYI